MSLEGWVCDQQLAQRVQGKFQVVAGSFQCSFALWKGWGSWKAHTLPVFSLPFPPSSQWKRDKCWKKR